MPALHLVENHALREIADEADRVGRPGCRVLATISIHESRCQRTDDPPLRGRPPNPFASQATLRHHQLLPEDFILRDEGRTRTQHAKHEPPESTKHSDSLPAEAPRPGFRLSRPRPPNTTQMEKVASTGIPRRQRPLGVADGPVATRRNARPAGGTARGLDRGRRDATESGQPGEQHRRVDPAVSKRCDDAPRGPADVAVVRDEGAVTSRPAERDGALVGDYAPTPSFKSVRPAAAPVPPRRKGGRRTA